MEAQRTRKGVFSGKKIIEDSLNIKYKDLCRLGFFKNGGLWKDIFWLENGVRCNSVSVITELDREELTGLMTLSYNHKGKAVTQTFELTARMQHFLKPEQQPKHYTKPLPYTLGGLIWRIHDPMFPMEGLQQLVFHEDLGVFVSVKYAIANGYIYEAVTKTDFENNIASIMRLKAKLAALPACAFKRRPKLLKRLKDAEERFNKIVAAKMAKGTRGRKSNKGKP